MQYFATQLRGEQETTRTLRASQYRKAAKTTLNDQDDEPSANPDTRVQAPSPELAQLRVAGLLPDDEYQVPPAPFPHAPAKIPRGRHAPTKVQQEMAKSPSRLFAVNAPAKSASVNGRNDENKQRMNHLNVLSAVMHRGLLEGDYERAGRAWGMILRTRGFAGGRRIDPRNNGRWGIGAEILLHRRHRNATGQNDKPQDKPELTDSMFSEDGFELAREYYERMIVLHPNSRTHPHAVDERSFYPAMFSLWIFETCEKSRRARKQAQDEAALRSRSSRGTSPDSALDGHVHDSHTKEDAIQVEELARAMEVAERLDQLIVSPPFDKEASLLQLRGNIGLWISDLVVGKTALDEDWDMDPIIRNVESNSESVAEQLTRLTNCHRELQQAKSFFLRAAANDAKGQAATLSSIDIKIRELARRLDKLRAPRQDVFSSFLTSDH